MNPLFLALVGFFSGLTASMGLGGGFVLLICFSLFTELPQLENQLMNLTFFPAHRPVLRDSARQTPPH